MYTTELTNQVLALTVRAIEMNDAGLLKEAVETLRPNLTEWMDSETNELVRNLDNLLTVTEEQLDLLQTHLYDESESLSVGEN